MISAQTRMYPARGRSRLGTSDRCSLMGDLSVSWVGCDFSGTAIWRGLNLPSEINFRENGLGRSRRWYRHLRGAAHGVTRRNVQALKEGA